MYPKGVTERQYQMDIIRTSLFNNTLVCLPTGLGKTLIAAVVMHNFTRWFPEVRPFLCTTAHCRVLEICRMASAVMMQQLCRRDKVLGCGCLSSCLHPLPFVMGM